MICEAIAHLSELRICVLDRFDVLDGPGRSAALAWLDVLADTVYQHAGRSVIMPVAWTKSWGAGRVFYNALGHHPDEFTTFPEARRLTVRGCLWAAGLL
jgi:type 1 glutamine amidotransferase